jgi:hypothetical protein
MKRLRRALAPIAVAWLLCHAATLTTAPVLFWLGSAEGLLECTCARGDHAICPMHHKSAAGSKICLMRGADDGGIAVLTSLLGGVGIVPVTATVITPASTLAVVVSSTVQPSLRPPQPDPPPPRA